MTIFRRASHFTTQENTASSSSASVSTRGPPAEIWDALPLWVLGRIDESLRLADRALADAGSAEHPPTLAYVHVFGTLLGLLRRSTEATAAASQALADIVSQYGLAAAFGGYATFHRGWANWSRSGGEAGLAEMRNGIAIQGEQGLFSFLPPQEAALAEA